MFIILKTGTQQKALLARLVYSICIVWHTEFMHDLKFWVRKVSNGRCNKKNCLPKSPDPFPGHGGVWEKHFPHVLFHSVSGKLHLHCVFENYFILVVYEHRARLERSLQKEKTDHKNTKLGWYSVPFCNKLFMHVHEALSRVHNPKKTSF